MAQILLSVKSPRAGTTGRVRINVPESYVADGWGKDPEAALNTLRYAFARAALWDGPDGVLATWTALRVEGPTLVCTRPHTLLPITLVLTAQII